jgi:hypothetical protein
MDRFEIYLTEWRIGTSRYDATMYRSARLGIVQLCYLRVSPLKTCSEHAKISSNLHATSLLLVGDSLQPQELFNTPISVEATKSTRLRATVGQSPLVMYCHRVDMDSSVFSLVNVFATTPHDAATYPLSICLATLSPRPRFSVNTAPDRP